MYISPKMISLIIPCEGNENWEEIKSQAPVLIQELKNLFSIIHKNISYKESHQITIQILGELVIEDDLDLVTKYTSSVEFLKAEVPKLTTPIMKSIKYDLKIAALNWI